MKEYGLYGFGGLGIKFYNYFIGKGYKVNSIIDKGKASQCYEKFIIQDPNGFSNYDLPIIITILNEYADLNEIKQFLYGVGFKKVYTLFEIIQELDLQDFNHLFIQHPKFYNETKFSNKANQVRQLLSDEKSKLIFDALIDFRKTLNYDKINSFYDENMYLPQVILKQVITNDKINVIDCGACFGDLIDIFQQKSIKIDNYYAFEPDSSNLKKLKSKIEHSNINSCVFPMGVGDFTGLIGFNTGAGTGCNIDKNSDNKILVAQLDDVILSDVNFLKMDIEGFENEALNGAKTIIQKHKPILAISIYHKPFDFIDIPLSLSQIMKDSTSEYIENSDSILSCMQYENFYIRYHGNHGFEFVLYAF